MLLENELLEQIDELLLEGWPPVLLNIPHKYKKQLASMLYVGNDSKQEKITPEQATKAPYSTGLIIITDRDYIPKVGFLGSTLVPLKSYYSNKDKPNRKKTLEEVQAFNGKIFYISPDKGVAEKLKKRESRPEDYAPTAKSYHGKEQGKQFKKLIDKYFEKKKEEIGKLGPRIKEKLKQNVEDRAKQQFEALKDSTKGYRYVHDYIEQDDLLTKSIIGLARAIQKLVDVHAYPQSSYWGADRATKKRAENEKHGQTMEFNYSDLTTATQEIANWTKRLKEVLE